MSKVDFKFCSTQNIDVMLCSNGRFLGGAIWWCKKVIFDVDWHDLVYLFMLSIGETTGEFLV